MWIISVLYYLACLLVVSAMAAEPVRPPPVPAPPKEKAGSILLAIAQSYTHKHPPAVKPSSSIVNKSLNNSIAKPVSSKPPIVAEPLRPPPPVRKVVQPDAHSEEMNSSSMQHFKWKQRGVKGEVGQHISGDHRGQQQYSKPVPVVSSNVTATSQSAGSGGPYLRKKRLRGDEENPNIRNQN